MTFSKKRIVDTMKETGVVPIFTNEDPEDARQAMEAAYRGGVRVFEFTNRRKNAFEVFVELLKAANKYPDLILGIGTVLDGRTAKKFIEAGAHFIISPILKIEMAGVCGEYDKLWIPGAATMTEIITAKENGAELIKIFPGSVLGPGFVSSVLSVVPELHLLITGGVEPNEKSLSAWFNAGAVCVGLGSQLFTKEILAQKDWHLLEQKIADVLGIAKAVRR
jgi:2-dehydro-3-deoxyphosphogluconate aldolase/(4S)-4-hydroxy-2-oxoglutarate aldolase